jgi:hypothetical protein
MAIVPSGRHSVEPSALLGERCSRARNDLGRSADDLGSPGRPRPSALLRRVELRRTRTDDGYEYLAILIREPLAASDVARIQRFLDEIDTDPSARWVYRPGHNG